MNTNIPKLPQGAGFRVTSSCLIQGKCVWEWRSLSNAFDTEVNTMSHSQRASFIGLYAVLLIFNVEPLGLQMIALPKAQ